MVGPRVSFVRRFHCSDGNEVRMAVWMAVKNLQGWEGRIDVHGAH